MVRKLPPSGMQVKQKYWVLQQISLNLNVNERNLGQYATVFATTYIFWPT